MERVYDKECLVGGVLSRLQTHSSPERDDDGDADAG